MSVPQSQASLADQLDQLERLAIDHGLYDAQDWVRNLRDQAVHLSLQAVREADLRLRELRARHEYIMKSVVP